MKKILVSWIAWTYDFKDGEVDESGPTMSLHQNAWTDQKADLHLMLDPSGGEMEQADFLFARVRNQFPDQPTELLPVGLDDILDFREIKRKVTEALKPYQNDELILLISNGTTPMRTVWILFHLEQNGFTSRLIQGVGPGMPGGMQPHFRSLELDENIFIGQLMARYTDQNAPKQSDFVTTTLIPVYSEAEIVAEADPVPVLIEGPSGSGKESLARHVHACSPRNRQQLLAINCAAIDDQLLEARLFGYKKGAFTGAEKDQKGLFQAADKSTIFLDEIGDITPRLQKSLLRVLQDGDVMRVGATKVEKVDVRVIAATNKNLWTLCKEGKFRWDLYYRLAVAELRLPGLSDFPIAEKKSILKLMIDRKRSIGKGIKLRLSPEAERRILAHPFPGNFRELENLVTSLYVFARGKKVTDKVLERLQIKQPERWDLTLLEVEKRHIRCVLDACDGNYTQASRVLEISVNTIKSKMKE